MTPQPTERGRADVVGLIVALGAAAAMVGPLLALRASPDYAAATNPQAHANVTAAAPGAAALRDLESATAALEAARDRVRVTPDRRFGPHPQYSAAAARVTGLDGSVVGGELSLRWLPPQGATGVRVRITGLGGDPAGEERIVPADKSALRVPVPAAGGTAVITARPLGVDGSTAEERVAIPFRVPVHVQRVVSVAPDSGEAVLRLERAFDGRAVTADLRVLEDALVGGTAPAGPGGPAIAFDTGLVLERIRSREVAVDGGTVRVPLFRPDGRVERYASGGVRMTERAIPAGTRTVVEVVLRAPGDERRILEVGAAGSGR